VSKQTEQLSMSCCRCC